MTLLGFEGGLLVDSQEVDDLETDNALKTTTEVEGKAALEPEDGTGRHSEEEDLGGDVERGAVLAHQEGFGAETWVYSHFAAYAGGRECSFIVDTADSGARRVD